MFSNKAMPGEDSIPSHLCLHCQLIHEQISLKKYVSISLGSINKVVFSSKCSDVGFCSYSKYLDSKVLTLIKLVLKERSDQCLHCYSNITLHT